MTDWYQDPVFAPNLTVFEMDHEPKVIYDHTGQPLARPKPPLGFIDPNNPPAKTMRTK